MVLETLFKKASLLFKVQIVLNCREGGLAPSFRSLFRNVSFIRKCSIYHLTKTTAIDMAINENYRLYTHSHLQFHRIQLSDYSK